MSKQNKYVAVMSKPSFKMIKKNCPQTNGQM